MCNTACKGKCTTCNPDTGACLTCPDGSSVNANADDCVTCTDANATKCTGTTGATSTACKSGYAVTGTVCYKVGNCDSTVNTFSITADETCATGAGCAGKGYTVDANNANKCTLACITNCATCSDATYAGCTTPKNGFCKSGSKSAIIATPTTLNCATFDGTDCLKCGSCLAGFYLDAGACKPCPSGCSCSAANTCDACRDAG